MLRRLMIVIGILLLASTATMAGPFYFGASAAKTNLQVEDLNGTYDDSDTTYKAFVGYRFIKYFGIEGGYVDFGTFNDETSGIDLEVDSTAWDLFVVGILPLGTWFELFGKAGYFQWDRNAETSGLVTGTENDSGNNLVYGGGMAFVFGKHFALRLEYERYEMNDVENLDQESAGIEFRF
jgi:OOP family OmpA-OmpF porin